MARSQVMKDGGLSVRHLEAINGTIAAAVTAAGSSQSDATLIEADNNLITSASANQGVRLPADFNAGSILIANGTAVAVLVYPASGGKLNNGTTDAAVALHPGLALKCYAISLTQCLVVYVAIPDGSVSTAKLADGAVTTAKIADDQVTYAKIQNVSATSRILGRKTASAGDTEECTLSEVLDFISSATKGDLLVRDTSAWARLAAGTSGHILTANGAGSLPSYQAASGGITTIASGSLPAAATQDITNIPATYAYLVLHLSGVSSNTATRQPLVQVDTDNGASFDATAGNYLATFFETITDTITQTTLASLIQSATQAAAGTWDATILLHAYHAGPHKKWSAHVATGAGVSYLVDGFYIGSTAAINAMRILWDDTGNFDAGTYALYGIS